MNSITRFSQISEEDINSMIIESKKRVQKKLREGGYREHVITNSAVSFSDKENAYLEGYLCFLKTKNFMYVLECK